MQGVDRLTADVQQSASCQRTRHVLRRFINGLKAQGTEVKDAKVLFYGAGSSAVGVANMIASLLQKEGGLSEKDAKEVSSPPLPPLSPNNPPSFQ